MGKKTEMQPACRDYTLNLHKRLQGIQFKQRAPKAIKNIRKFAQKEMFTQVSTSMKSWRVSLQHPFLFFESWGEYSFKKKMVSNLVWFLCDRRCALTPSWTEWSGLPVSETFLVKCVSELPERETRTRTHPRSSSLLFSTSKLTLSSPCRPRKLDRSGAFKRLEQPEQRPLCGWLTRGPELMDAPVDPDWLVRVLLIAKVYKLPT